MSMIRIRSVQTALFAVGTLVGVVFATAFSSSIAPTLKTLGFHTSSSLALNAGESRCDEGTSEEEVYFVSCGGLF